MVHLSISLLVTCNIDLGHSICNIVLVLCFQSDLGAVEGVMQPSSLRKVTFDHWPQVQPEPGSMGLLLIRLLLPCNSDLGLRFQPDLKFTFVCEVHPDVMDRFCRAMMTAVTVVIEVSCCNSLRRSAVTWSDADHSEYASTRLRACFCAVLGDGSVVT